MFSGEPSELCLSNFPFLVNITVRKEYTDLSGCILKYIFQRICIVLLSLSEIILALENSQLLCN